MGGRSDDDGQDPWAGSENPDAENEWDDDGSVAQSADSGIADSPLLAMAMDVATSATEPQESTPAPILPGALDASRSPTEAELPDAVVEELLPEEGEEATRVDFDLAQFYRQKSGEESLESEATVEDPGPSADLSAVDTAADPEPPRSPASTTTDEPATVGFGPEPTPTPTPTPTSSDTAEAQGDEAPAEIPFNDLLDDDQTGGAASLLADIVGGGAPDATGLTDEHQAVPAVDDDDATGAFASPLAAVEESTPVLGDAPARSEAAAELAQAALAASDDGLVYEEPPGFDEGAMGEAFEGASDWQADPDAITGSQWDAVDDASEVSGGTKPLAPTPSGPAAAGDPWGDDDAKGDWRDSVVGSNPAAAAVEASGVERAADIAEGPEAPAALRCTVGQAEGRSFKVEGAEVGIGRDPTNGVCLTDASVSRHHAVILFDGNVYTVVDQKSGNGTFVNGKRVDRARVRSGDEVGFGKTRFRFDLFGEGFKPVDISDAPVRGEVPSTPLGQLRSHPWFGKVVLGGGTAILAVLLVILVLVARGAGGGPAPEVVQQHFQAALQAFNRLDWAHAEASFKQLQQLAPKDNRAAGFLQAIARERQFEHDLNSARQAKNRGDLGEAYRFATAISESVYTADARGLIRQLDRDLDARVGLARHALSLGRAEDALQKLNGLERYAGGRVDVAALLARARGAAGSATPAPAERPVVATPSPAPTAPPAPADLAGVRAAMLAGDLSGALVAAKGLPGADATALVERLQPIVDAYQGGLRAADAGDLQKGLKLLKQAQQLDGQASGPPSGFGARVRGDIARTYVAQGKQAQGQGQLAPAYRSFAMALATSPDEDAAKAELAGLARQAESMFAKGQQANGSGDSDGAAEQWMMVLQIVSPEHPLYAKAKAALNGL